MSDRLVVYYSRNGSTKEVAEKLAEYLECDTAEIISKKKYRGPFGFLAAGRSSMRGELVEIKEPELKPENYESVIICSPVWASRPSSPVRTYLNSNKGKFKQLSYVLTMGGTGFEQAYETLSGIAGEPVKKVHFSKFERKTDVWVEKLKAFANEL